MEKENVVDVLNDLLSIINDRLEGYEKALNELEEPLSDKAQALLLERSHESRVLYNELTAAVNRLGGKPAKDTTVSGKLYRTWMDLKTTFTGGSAKSVFELCEFGEDAALKAYDEALEDDVDWPSDIFQMLKRQRQIIKNAHDAIKRYRDELKRVDV